MSVVANVAVNLDARSARRQLEDFINSSRRATDQLQDFANRSRQTETVIGGVARAVGKLALAYGTLRTAQAALQAGISRVESERRIQFLARGYGEAAQLATAASRAAQKFGVSQTEANQALANTYARLRPVGIELSTIESVYAGFNTAARISGASAVEASNAFTQLAQALGSGALRGDEFNSISEQVPGILTAISKETGVAQGALRKYAADGKITADVVIRALQRIEREGADQLAAALDGPLQKIKDFQNATEDVQVALTETVIPELATSLEGLAELIRNLEGPIRFIGGIAANTIGTVNDLINLVTKPGQVASRKAIEGGRLPLDSGAAVFGVGPTADLFKGTGPGGTGLKELTQQARELSELRKQPYEKVLVQLMQDRLKTMDAAMQGAVEQELSKPDRPKPLPENTKDTTKRKGAKAPKDDTPERIRESEQYIKVLDLERKLIEEQNPIKQIALQLDLDKLFAEQKYEDILANETNEIVRQNEEKIKGLKIDKATAQARNRSAQLGEQLGHDMARMFLNQKKQNKELTDTEKLYNGIYQTVATNLTQAIQGLIQGTATMNDIASQLLSQLGSLFLEAGFGMLGKALKIPGMAGGGGVSGGSPYLVGERGPELFVPGANGGVMSNSDLRSAMNAAPAAAGTPTLSMSFETTNIAGVEYVSRDQLEAAMAATRRSATRDGAKQGMSMTLDRLQQSPQVRSRVGLR